MPKQIAPFLMFTGNAEQAMTFYTSLFDDGRIVDITRFGPEGPGPEGTVQLARFSLAGQEFLCTDTFVSHGFSFTRRSPSGSTPSRRTSSSGSSRRSVTGAPS